MKTANEWARIIVDGCFLTTSKERSIEDLTVLVRKIQEDCVDSVVDLIATEKMTNIISLFAK